LFTNEWKCLKETVVWNFRLIVAVDWTTSESNLNAFYSIISFLFVQTNRLLSKGSWFIFLLLCYKHTRTYLLPQFGPSTHFLLHTRLSYTLNVAETLNTMRHDGVNNSVFCSHFITVMTEKLWLTMSIFLYLSNLKLLCWNLNGNSLKSMTINIT
jgi:hypothetical protein